MIKKYRLTMRAANAEDAMDRAERRLERLGYRVITFETVTPEASMMYRMDALVRKEDK